jgi:hypothetical protein
LNSSQHAQASCMLRVAGPAGAAEREQSSAACAVHAVTALLPRKSDTWLTGSSQLQCAGADIAQVLHYSGTNGAAKLILSQVHKLGGTTPASNSRHYSNSIRVSSHAPTVLGNITLHHTYLMEWPMPHFHTSPSASGGSKLRSTTQLLLLLPPAHDTELLGSLLQLTPGPMPAEAPTAACCCCSSC